MRPTYAEIDLSNLKFNYINIRKKVKNKKIMAVVKADAYGHGVKETVNALNSLGERKPEYYAVAVLEEAKELVGLKIKQPVLIFEPIIKEDIDSVLFKQIIPTVFNDEHLRILLKNNKQISSGSKAQSRIRVHVKIDTGMNRLGVKYNEALNFVHRLSRNKNFLIDGMYTHFATSDEKNKEFAYLQLDRFNKLVFELKAAGIRPGVIHAANSGAIIDIPDAYFDMVRPGISLYGYYPSTETTESIRLKPVMSIVSYVASIKEIEPGESVSYGRLFYAERYTKIISVPIGYADGYNRNLTNKSKAILNGKIYNQVGRVTMDRIMFDVGNDNVKVGQKIILMGKDKGLKYDAWDWSHILGTIPYEITCNISKRVPRIYKD